MANEQLNELINEWILPMNIWYTNSWMNNKWMNITDEYMVYEQLNELINKWILPMNIWYTNSWMKCRMMRRGKKAFRWTSKLNPHSTS